VVPLNQIAQSVFSVLVNDRTTGEWLFTNRDGKPIKSIIMRCCWRSQIMACFLVRIFEVRDRLRMRQDLRLVARNFITNRSRLLDPFRLRSRSFGPIDTCLTDCLISLVHYSKRQPDVAIDVLGCLFYSMTCLPSEFETRPAA